jgi:DNA-binding LacI/PurR family transcriptional regulator
MPALRSSTARGRTAALGERGLRAPCDVSVVGFDDVIAEWATPPLTTIRQPLAAMTAAGFRMLRMGADRSPAQPQHVELATSLIVRDSTAPPGQPGDDRSLPGLAGPRRYARQCRSCR